MATTDEPTIGVETPVTAETALGVAQGAADDLATLRADFEAFKNDVSETLGNARTASPEEFERLAERLQRVYERVLPND